MSIEALAAEALTAWGDAVAPPRLIKDRENAVFDVRLAAGPRAALRLHRPAYQSAAAIRSELWWTDRLHKAGLPVPRPIPEATGGLLHQTAGGRLASLVTWVDGTALGEAGVSLACDATVLQARFHAIGTLIGRLHNATDAMDLPPEFTRPRWDVDGFLGETPFWGRFWENPSLTDPEREIIQAARAAAREALFHYLDDGADFGLIHADVLRENVFFDGDTPALIDFDDCGFGFRLYDLATLASQNEGEPAFPALMDAAIAGYRSCRPLPDRAVRLLPLFLMLRRFASCGWIVPRASPSDPAVRTYAARAVAAAQRFLGSPRSASSV